jgi:hypothetical protein
MSQKTKRTSEWQEARRRCRLSGEAVAMAKEMGLNPRSLINNIPDKSQPWKEPVEVWIRKMYEKRQVKSSQKKPRHEAEAGTTSRRSSKTQGAQRSAPNGRKQAGKPTPKRRGSEGVRARLEEIRKIVASLKGSTIPEKLWDSVKWMIEHGRENMIYKLLEDERLSEEAIFTLAFILEEIGYRHPVVLQVASPDGEAEHRIGTMIPFAIIFAAVVRERDLARFPNALPKAIARATEKKLIRRSCGLGENPSILLDSHLYHIDHSEWTRESSVRTYLKGWLGYLAGHAPSIQPLSNDYRKRPDIGAHYSGQGAVLEEQYCLILRALCGVAIAQEEDEVEAMLFESEENDDESLLPDQQEAWDEMEEIISKEFADHFSQEATAVFLYPQAVELWDIPQVGLSMYRKIPLEMALENAMDELLVTAPEGEVINPTLYISHHGKRGVIEEIRAAAYTSVQEHPFFNYVWEIDREVDDMEEIANDIIDVANQLQAMVIAVDGLLPNDRCPDCGEPTFCGPGDRIFHDHEVDYLN